MGIRAHTHMTVLLFKVRTGPTARETADRYYAVDHFIPRLDFSQQNQGKVLIMRST